MDYSEHTYLRLAGTEHVEYDSEWIAKNVQHTKGELLESAEVVNIVVLVEIQLSQLFLTGPMGDKL